MTATALALTPLPTPSLYEGVLGPAWAQLPALVRRMHEEGSASGHFTIWRSTGLLSALLGWLCRFPAAGEGVATRLRVRRDGEAQRWERDFGGHRLTTLQRAWEGGRIGEKLGPVECVFRFEAVQASLVYQQVGAWLCVGPWRLRLPRLAAPRIEATTTAAPEGMRVLVKIGAPLLGWLLTYDGLVSPEETAS